MVIKCPGIIIQLVVVCLSLIQRGCYSTKLVACRSAGMSDPFVASRDLSVPDSSMLQAQ